MSLKIKKLKIPIYVSRPLLPDLDEMNKKLNEIWHSRWLTNHGEQSRILEMKLKEYLNVHNLSLVNNGTTALLIAIRAMNLTGEIITTPFTFPATPHAILWSNLTPVFCDIDYDTMCIDPSIIESLITERTSAILPVHVFGTPCNTKAIQDIADEYKLKILYDAAHAFGVDIHGEPIGHFGDITMMSFHATKLFHTAEGGGLIYSDHELGKTLHLLQNFGIENEEEVSLPGINGKMTEIQAALGLLLLDNIEQEIQKRASIIDLYKSTLRDIEGITLNEDIPGVKNSHQYFIIRIDENIYGSSRDETAEKLVRYNIFPRKYFFPLCSNYSCYHKLPSSDPAKLPVANQVASEVLCLPLYGELQINTVEMICEILKCQK